MEYVLSSVFNAYVVFFSVINTFTATCNTNPIFYGEAPNAGIQDYAVTYKPYVDYNTSIV